MTYIIIGYSCGDRYWYVNGQLSRKGGPAVIRKDGAEGWYIDGKLHRESGPAVLSKDYRVWYLDGRYVHSQRDWFVKVLGRKLLYRGFAKKIK